MKIASLLFMLLGVLLIAGFAVVALLGFATSFDAPGSAQSPVAWAIGLSFFLPVLGLVVALIFAAAAHYSGNYRRSVRIGSVFAVTAALAAAFAVTTSLITLSVLWKANREEAELGPVHPVETFSRPVEGGFDQVIVFPEGTVFYRPHSYRLPSGANVPYSGPLGDLNANRDTIVLDRSSDTKVKFEELGQFVDEKGRKLTDVYSIR